MKKMNSDGKPASPSPPSHHPVVTTGNPTGQDPSSNLGQTQGNGSIRQSNMRHRPVLRSGELPAWLEAGNHGQTQGIGSIQQSNMLHRPVLRSGNHGQTQGIGSIQQSNMLHRPVLRSGELPALSEAGNHGQTQGIGSIRQSNMLHRPVVRSDPRISAPRGRNRGDSQPQSSIIPTTLVYHRRNSQTHPFLPTTTRSAPSVSNTDQTSTHLTHTNPSRSHQLSPLAPPFIPRTHRSSLSVPTLHHTDKPINYGTPSLLPQASDKIASSFRPTSQSLPPHGPQTSRPVTYSRLEGSVKPIGQKCCLCKRDMSFPPEGPISEPSLLPAAAVLPCGHAFHDFCLRQMTLDEHSAYPFCIPCALGE